MLAMNKFDQQVLALLLSKSRAQTSPAVFREWEHLGKWSGWCSDVCQLCGHRGYKYRHLIRNRITREILMIGSTCIGYWEPNGIGYVERTCPVVPPPHYPTRPALAVPAAR